LKNSVKGIESILFLKNGLGKKISRKNYKNHLRSDNYEAAVTLCFPNILSVMVLENVNLSEEKISVGRRPM
jgi:hypothetical protein